MQKNPKKQHQLASFAKGGGHIARSHLKDCKKSLTCKNAIAKEKLDSNCVDNKIFQSFEFKNKMVGKCIFIASKKYSK